MIIGIPKEIKNNENRVGMTPAGVAELTGRGQQVIVQHDAGANSGFTDADYVAAGAQIILFTTGRGTGVGAPVPTLKIASNTPLAQKKKNWIDFDGFHLGEENSPTEELFQLLIDTANGKLAKNEINGYKEISIFKDGVTL